RELGLQDAFVVLCVARLSAEKDHRTLIDACARAQQTVPELHLLLVGDGPVRMELEKRAFSSMKPGTVTFTGSQANVIDWYDAADVFALTSTTEGFPNALVEAMARGLPAAVTEVGGVRNVIDDSRNGLSCPASTADCIAAAIVRLSRDQGLRQKLG